MTAANRSVGVAASLTVLVVAISAFARGAEPDPLPSWNEGRAKTAILELVRAVTDPKSPQFVPAEQRLAAFDNDGTLWVEQPMYTQVMFALDRVVKLAPEHPDWKTQEPFKTVLSGDRQALANFTLQDLEKVVMATHAGLSVPAFDEAVSAWLATARHPRFKRPYTELTYQPMLEVLAYMRSQGIKTYIVTGGGQAFVRNFAEKVYGVGPAQVIGSALATTYSVDAAGKGTIMRSPKLLLNDNNSGKPEDIYLFTGTRPQFAFGNSTGDQQMLEWTQSGGEKRLAVLIHHDDAEREYDYGPKSRVGTFSDALMAEAKKREWIVVSMKNDWKRMFPFDK